MKSVSAIVLAGGSGSRFGSSRNKVLLDWRGKPLIAHSLEVFLQHPAVSEVILVYRPEDEASVRLLAEQYRLAGRPLRLTAGGATRQASVLAGLRETAGELVLVHDGARPLVTAAMIDRLLEALETVPGAAVAVPAKDTIKLTDENGLVQSTTKRACTWLVQTPQGFCTRELLAAHETFGDRPDITDDCMLMEAAGHPVRLVMGAYTNLKVTTPEDMRLLEALGEEA